MELLIESIVELVANSPPDKVTQLAKAVRKLASASEARSLEIWASNPGARKRLVKLLSAWQSEDVPPLELAGMLSGAGLAYHWARTEQEVELVWTGPSSKLVATRKTEQSLLQVIDASEKHLFMTSFVAYDVAAIMAALGRAASRDVAISMLLEASDKHGGSVSVDALSAMKKSLPTARLFSWNRKEAGFVGGKVHAKVAVADERVCFISSANLTGHAMEKNMEAGVLITGGSTPKSLHRHLDALVTTSVIARV